MTATRLLFDRFEGPGPIGFVLLVSNGARLIALDFGDPDARLLRLIKARFGPETALEPASDANGFTTMARAYFKGHLDALDTIPVDGGGTPFQRAVWAALRAIPAGETRSYGQIAAAVGRPGAARAVGLANARNPVNLAVPCHRVVGGSGALTGYGGGIARKRWLLAHEQGASGTAGDINHPAHPFEIAEHRSPAPRRPR